MGVQLRAPKQWSQEEVVSLVREIIGDLAPNKTEILDELRLIEDLAYHSLSLLELAFSLEDEFVLPTIDEQTARQILTVQDVERHVLNHLTSTKQLTT